jgi:hypothetical protein
MIPSQHEVVQVARRSAVTSRLYSHFYSPKNLGAFVRLAGQVEEILPQLHPNCNYGLLLFSGKDFDN